SVGAWGFLPPVQAFFVSNFFHALQYFGIVWWIEKGNIRRSFGLARLEAGGDLALGGFVALLGGVGGGRAGAGGLGGCGGGEGPRLLLREPTGRRALGRHRRRDLADALLV